MTDDRTDSLGQSRARCNGGLPSGTALDAIMAEPVSLRDDRQRRGGACKMEHVITAIAQNA